MAGSAALFTLVFTAGLIATIWWPVEVRVFGYEIGVGSYDRRIVPGYHDWGNGRGFVLNFGRGAYRVAWSRSSVPVAPEIKIATP